MGRYSVRFLTCRHCGKLLTVDAGTTKVPGHRCSAAVDVRKLRAAVKTLRAACEYYAEGEDGGEARTALKSTKEAGRIAVDE